MIGSEWSAAQAPRISTLVQHAASRSRTRAFRLTRLDVNRRPAVPRAAPPATGRRDTRSGAPAGDPDAGRCAVAFDVRPPCCAGRRTAPRRGLAGGVADLGRPGRGGGLPELPSRCRSPTPPPGRRGGRRRPSGTSSSCVSRDASRAPPWPASAWQVRSGDGPAVPESTPPGRARARRRGPGGEAADRTAGDGAAQVPAPDDGADPARAVVTVARQQTSSVELPAPGRLPRRAPAAAPPLTLTSRNARHHWSAGTADRIAGTPRATASAAFLFPSTLTLPASGWPPRTTSVVEPRAGRPVMALRPHPAAASRSGRRPLSTRTRPDRRSRRAA